MAGRERGDAAAAATLDKAGVVAAYQRWAPIYDFVFGAITRPSIKAAVGIVNRMGPSRVIEVGVGTGIALPYYEREHRVVGIDLSPDMLKRAEERVARDGLRQVEGLIEMDAGSLVFEDGAFDAAVAMFVMSVVPEPEKVLAEMARVVRPGGRIVVVNHFAVEGGIRGAFEKWLSRFGRRLGWHPDFKVERVMGRGDLKLVERRTTAPGIYTLLVFERV
ncbi:MAG: class I SAM-dependent methyltransferase [Rhizobiales bacterium]|nr:class I SAM-dependent methyltransferase [Hyphomicrobiales bacterium]MBN9011029.1 class I SAM-dependent methyltransferase [Hyphomicrobiales bacterium]